MKNHIKYSMVYENGATSADVDDAARSDDLGNYVIICSHAAAQDLGDIISAMRTLGLRDAADRLTLIKMAVTTFPDAFQRMEGARLRQLIDSSAAHSRGLLLVGLASAGRVEEDSPALKLVKDVITSGTSPQHDLPEGKRRTGRKQDDGPA